VKEVKLSRPGLSVDAASFLACLATILELPETEIPDPSGNDEPSKDWNVLGWLGSLEVGLVPVAEPRSFAWPGPWIARARVHGGERRSVVMYGREPPGVVWDPIGGDAVEPGHIEDGFVVAAEDIALGMPRRVGPSAATGSVEQIWISAQTGQPGRSLDSVQVIPGEGLHGDRYISGLGTFPSGRPGSALTLIEAEVCESFQPPLQAEEHRRNLVTRGISLNGMVGREFAIGSVRCRAIRLCEPCATMQRYSERPVLRPLVHRGGIRADILEAGEIRVGDRITLVGEGA
jgi:MOSC domain-containing protein YiiM